MIFLNNLKIYVWMSDFMYLRDDVSYNSFMSDLIFIGRDWNIAAATTTTYYLLLLLLLLQATNIHTSIVYLLEYTSFIDTK